MDSKYEDNMLSQIEKNLSNNINENLFLTGRVFDNSKTLSKKKYLQEQEHLTENDNSGIQDYPLVSTDYISDKPAPLSRAELIRQAREACLRQLSNSQVYTKPYDLSFMDMDTSSTSLTGKKQEHLKWFFDTNSSTSDDNASPQEVAAFRSLIIRTVCALILFISIFIIDKFELKIGGLSNIMIEEYITGNNALKNLEDLVVTWLK